METFSYDRDDRRLSQKSSFLSHDSLLLMCSKMAASTTELSSSLFMEEVQKYLSIYNKFCKEYKNKFTKMNCWKAGRNSAWMRLKPKKEKYKNVRNAYGRYLKKRKSVPPAYDKLLTLLSFDTSAEPKICVFVELLPVYGANLRE